MYVLFSLSRCHWEKMILVLRHTDVTVHSDEKVSEM